MKELETFTLNGLKCQLFNGRVYCLRPSDPRYFETGDHKRLHIDVWMFHNGGQKPPKKHHIHHKDGDKENNHPDNLELQHGSKHISEHARQRVRDNPEKFQALAKTGQEAAAKWSKTEKGLKYRREHARNVLSKFYTQLHTKHIAKICIYCGDGYLTTKTRATISKFCSGRCKAAYARRKLRVISST